MTSDQPSRRRISGRALLLALVLAVLFIAWAPPILGGFHLGCNPLMDHLRETRLGLEFCK